MNLTPNHVSSLLLEKYKKLDAPCDWLSGIRFSARNGKLIISFVHSHFAEWFFEEKKEEFLVILESITGTTCKIEFEKAESASIHKKRTPPDAKKDSAESTLENFLDIERNGQALAGAYRFCSRNAGQFDSPLIMTFCGESATGKSHLLNGILRKFYETGQNARITDTLQFFQNSELMQDLFSGKFWKVNSALLFENLQDIINDFELQEKLSKIISMAELHVGQKETLPPKFAFTWQGRQGAFDRLRLNLRLRLEKGLVFQLHHPDLATRISFVEKETSKFNISLTREQTLYLARQGQYLPIIQGHMAKLRLFVSVTGKEPSVEEFRNILENQNGRQTNTWDYILETVSQKLRLDKKQVLGESRKPDLVYARQIVMFLCKTSLGMTSTEIGRLFGGKDHSTVMHGVNKIKKLQLTHKETRNLLADVDKMLI